MLRVPEPKVRVVPEMAGRIFTVSAVWSPVCTHTEDCHAPPTHQPSLA